MTTSRIRTALLGSLVLVAAAACGGGDGGSNTAAPSVNASPSASPSPSPSPEPSPVTSASGQPVATKINLTAADLPGYTATPPDQSEAKGSEQEKTSEACIGASTTEPVAKFASDDLKKGAELPSIQFASKVSFSADAATTKSDLAAYSSQKATTCLTTFAADTFKTIGAGAGITFGTPEVTKLTPAATGVDGAFGYSITAAATAQGMKIPFTIEILGASKGRTQLSLTAYAIGTSVPGAQRDELFATLVKRTSENAL